MERCSHICHPTTFFQEEDNQMRQKNWKHAKTNDRCNQQWQGIRSPRSENLCWIPDFLKKKFSQQETETSSSSSSDSECEDEMRWNTTRAIDMPSFTRWQQQRQLQQNPRKWFTLVDLEGIPAGQVTAKVNPKCHVLIIKIKEMQQEMEFKGFLPQRHQQSQSSVGGKLIRVIPLPDNIRLEKLRVEVLPRGDRLIVKAPLTLVGEEGVQQQGRFLPTWIPIRVTRKEEADHLFTNNKRFGRISCPQGRGGMNTWAMDDIPSSWKKGSSRKWGKKMLQLEDDSFFHGSCSLMKISEITRDEVSGKPVMLVKMNICGFRPEEIRVRVDERERVLIVEADKKQQQQQQGSHNLPEMEQRDELVVKYLRREFVLPPWVDVTRTSFRVVKNSLLLIKLPIVKQNKMSQNNTNINTACWEENWENQHQMPQKNLTKKEWKKLQRA